ncbi:NAD-dependent epimerase/dehydratase family protein [Haloarchaeobius litoreus]|uniref:NAD-dependent epimerase/dehydratase family protein n=1 Tax=Haloarchaeobius litoreus TaxID=755306 RepID=A0ABD6DPI3_9EURY|nr:NAD(P)-dependent oxidoreductase [Haloarchaeobius litoreus]
MHVAITGAAGKVGRVAVGAFDRDQLTLLTHHEHEEMSSELLDATDRDAFVDALDGVDVLVHLAWVPGERSDWSEGEEANLRITTNAMAAARENDLDRVVMASSAHVHGMYNRDDPSRFESTVENPTTTIDTETPPRPDSYYGVAKVATEALCSYNADRYDLDIVVVRIGWLMSREELREMESEAADRYRFARAMWLSHRDCRALLRAAAKTPIDHSPVIAHGISANGDRYLTLTETMQHLDYRPQDDSAAVLD